MRVKRNERWKTNQNPEKTTKEMDLKDLYILSFYFHGYDFIVTKQKNGFTKTHVRSS